MKKFRALMVVASLVGSSAASAGQGYQPRGFLRSGYSDKQLGPGIWSVRGSSREQGKSVGVALYHAAELAAQNGIAEIRVTKQNVRSQTMSDRRSGSIMSYHEATTVTIRAIRGDADRMACEMPEARQCLTLPIDRVMATYGPNLGMRAALPGAPMAAPLPIKAVSPYEAAVASFLARHRQATASAGKPAPLATAVPARAPRARSLADMRPDPAEDYERRLKAAQPVKSDPKQGWTVID